MSTEFASANYTAGQLNAMVKMLKKQAGEDGPELFLRGEFQLTRIAQAVQSLLEFTGTVVIPATTTMFVAKTKFVVNTDRNAPVKIRYLSDNFIAWFLNGDGKTEDPQSEQTLRYHKLRQSSVDGPIIAELGGAEKSETTLSGMFFFMKKQGKGEDGFLLNDGCGNIFHPRDSAGVLRTVDVYWRGDVWRVDAVSALNPVRWRGGCQVFSRISVLES